MLCSNKLRRKAKFQINSAKHIATEFIKSNKLRYASPVERLSNINLLCKQKSSGIIFFVKLLFVIQYIQSTSESKHGIHRLCTNQAKFTNTSEFLPFLKQVRKEVSSQIAFYHYQNTLFYFMDKVNTLFMFSFSHAGFFRLLNFFQ